MSDEPVRTRVLSDGGWIDFQDYFVRQQCRPVVRALSFDGAPMSRPAPGVTEALRTAGAIVICPSNPFISIEPILAVPGIREAIEASGAPVVAVSPIIGGKAVKGPTAKMMAELGMEATALGVARRYGEMLDSYVVEHEDAAAVVGIGARVTAAKTLMQSLEDREALARIVLEAADSPRR